MIKIGDTYPVWFKADAVVLAIEAYQGRYPECFSHVLRLTADTPKGWLEIAVDLRVDHG